MRNTGRLLATILMVALLCMAVGGSALAADSVITLKQGKYYSVLSAADGQQVYKLVLTKNSVVNVAWTNDDSATLKVEFYKDKACKNRVGEISSDFAATVIGKGNIDLVFAKGSYYVRMYDRDGSAKVKYTATTLKTTNNVTPAKATKLARNKAVISAFLPINNRISWYKIDIAKRRAVTFYIRCLGSFFVSYYNSEMQQHGGYLARGIYEETSMFDRGTHYIAVFSDGAFSRYCGPCVSVKWK